MGGWIIEEDCPEQLKWISELELEQQPPLSTLLNICAHYVSTHLDQTILAPAQPIPSAGVGGAGGYGHHPSDSSPPTDHRRGGGGGRVEPRPDVVLPLEVSQTIFNFCEVRETERGDSKTLAAFCPPIPSHTPLYEDWGGEMMSTPPHPPHPHPPPPNPLPLCALDFSSPNNLLDSPLLTRYLSRHGSTLITLNLSGSKRLDHWALHAINSHCPPLRNLILGGATQLLGNPPPLTIQPTHHGCQPREAHMITGPTALSKLVLHGWRVRGEDAAVVPPPPGGGAGGGAGGEGGTLPPFGYQSVDVWKRLLGRYEGTLTHLDLSGCGIHNFGFLGSLGSLRALLLYSVDLGEDSPNGFWSTLPHISKALSHLDLSQPASKLGTWGTFRNPNQLLDSVVRSLPRLLVLEIGGTNLAGDGVAQQMRVADGEESGQGGGDLCCDIPGLNSRSRRPLEYLGLYGSAHDASHRHAIPAKIVGGDKDELQIINAARVFIDRGEVLERILNDLFHLFRTEEGKHVSHSLRLILCAMERHPREKHIQISGSASLFYIVKNNQNLGPVHALKRRILAVIVRAMELHVTDSTMMRNGCLTICHFKIPQDVMFVYDKLVGILLETLGSVNPPPNPEDFNERIAIYLLNSLACQVEGEHKRLVGTLGAIQKMLGLIQGRLGRGECDDVMEIAWSTMWNVTDETPENCAKFLEHKGMALFLKCLQAFPDQPELLRNMMGLLGNVAEVAELRPHLMTEAFIQVFYQLLNSKQDNIEVSYNAAGVLAHILSDGESAWGGGGDWAPSRSQVCERMSLNIREWDLHSPRNINYRSFKPILRLLLVPHTVQCRLWAAWALANLTTVYPDKYVGLLEEEEGLSYLGPQLTDRDHPELVEYARLAYDNVVRPRGQLPPPSSPLPLVG